MIRLPTSRLISKTYVYNYRLSGPATERETGLLVSNLDIFFGSIGNSLGEALLAKDLDILLDRKGGNNFLAPRELHLNPNGLTQWTIVHELAHALDAAHGWQLSQQMKAHTGSGFLCKPLHYARPLWKFFWYRAGSPPPPCGIDQNFNALEDFAETVTAFIFPEEAKKRAEARGYPYEKWGYTHFHDTPRGQFFKGMVEQEKQ